MVCYITVLRALAAIIITNSHYIGIYPTDLIANGGLLGDVIFFAVSGFCLYNVKMNFGKWYLKRIIRVYSAPIIITAVYMIIGWYKLNGGISDAVRQFIYPTNYHFVASIIVLYVPFYFVMRIKSLKANLPWLLLLVCAVHILVYVCFYDKSYYHIDTVREPIIRFLFFEAMLTGAYFRSKHSTYAGGFKALTGLICVLIFIMYFASKMAFARYDFLSKYQILNQIILLALLYFVMKCFAGLNERLELVPPKLQGIIKYVADITLEIYVVQYAIIPKIVALELPFPINWCVVTVSILVAAAMLHFVVNAVNKQTNKLFEESK